MTHKKENSIKSFTSISGIGPALAEALYNQGLRTKTDLKKPKVFKKLPKASQYDLKYSPSRKISRTLLVDIIYLLRQCVGTYDIIIAGSYRRGKAYSGDIDLIICEEEPDNSGIFLKIDFECFANTINRSLPVNGIKLYALPYALGESKMSFILKIVNTNKGSANPFNGKKVQNTFVTFIKIDTFKTNKEELPFMLLYATGSGKLNIRMRAKAKYAGYTLNQKGLFKNNKPTQNIKTERDIFKKLQIAYIKPHDRNE
jgi:DNA polymerase/3'-5' exonuclease PolX